MTGENPWWLDSRYRLPLPRQADLISQQEMVRRIEYVRMFEPDCFDSRILGPIEPRERDQYRRSA